MREFLVDFLISLVSTHPYLLATLLILGVCAFIRAGLHESRIFLERLTAEVRGGKREVGELAGTLVKLKHELTSWEVKND